MLQQGPNNSSFHHHGRDNDLLQQQSNKYRKINDQLSSVLSEYQDLRPPNIVVIGEQSAGKSSVLEYLSGIRFVTGQNMVTKCPLQLRMVNSKSSSGSKAVIKSNIYLTKHSNKPITIENPEINDGAQQLEEAIQHLTSLHLQEEGYTGDVSRVSTHLIEVEITSPNVPDLTLIDLPGLITTSNEKNPTLKDDIRQLVKRNTTDRDCILIVGDAGRDLQTIVGFEEAREKDPSQKRTLCALTRVDKHVNDIETLNKMIESLNNRGPIKLVHGYVGLRNRLSDERDLSIEECEEKEASVMKKLTTVSDHFKGRKALIKKLTDIQNDHLKSSLPDLREKLKIELKKVNEEIENFSANVTAYLEGEESLVSLFEDNAKKIVKEFERVATHQGACINEEQSEDEVFKKLNHDDDNESNKVFSLPDFSKSMENMKNSIMQASEIQLDDDKCYLELAMNMLEKQRGFPGLPDLYQPTILIELTKLKLSSMQKSVTTTSEEVLQEWKSLVLDSIIPKSVKQVVDKDSTTDMLQHHLSTLLDKQIEKAIKLIEHYFNIERHRTTTLNSNYEHHQKTLAKYANELRNPTRDAKQVQEHGLPKADQTFIEQLVKRMWQQHDKVLTASAAMDLLIKFKAYLNIVCTRVADHFDIYLYDLLFVETLSHMEEYLKVRRDRNLSEDTERIGIPLEKVLEALKPTLVEIEQYADKQKKKRDIESAIDILKKNFI